ncbi:MAG: transposase [Patescibacteria group bacterium]|nr:transposase [Patescibacteria group bacterium]
MGDEYFKNKYRVPSTRLGHWNYADGGFYYVTICTKDRKCCLGEIRGNNVYLSKIGEIVLDEWLKTQKLRPNVVLDDFIIMPNHIHGIIVIKNNQTAVETHCNASLQRTEQRQNAFGPQRNNLSSITRGFKGSVVRNCRENNFDFEWQPRYYEHIIKNDEDYARIKGYIANNPVNWEFDRDNPKTFKIS